MVYFLWVKDAGVEDTVKLLLEAVEEQQEIQKGDADMLKKRKLIKPE